LKIEKKRAGLEGDLKTLEDAYDNLHNNMLGECRYCGNHIAGSKSVADKTLAITSKRDVLKAEEVILNVDIENIKRDISEVEEQIRQLNAEELEYSDKFAEKERLAKVISQIEKSDSMVRHIKKSISQLMTELEEAQAIEPSDIKSNIQRKKELILSTKEELSELSAKAENLELDTRALKLLEQGIKNTKSALFNNFILSLEDKINDNFMEMTEGDYHCELEAKGEDLALVFTNTSKDGEYKSYHVFSEGEKTRISKATSLALNELMDIGIFIDDEGLPGLDEIGEMSMLDFILKKNEGQTLFFISHNEKVADYFKSYKNLHVIKESRTGSVIER
jgi:hypothetical protein